MKRLARIVAVVAVQLLIALFLMEVIARAVDPLGVSYYPETARFYDRLIREEPISYRLPPGMKGNFHGVPVLINGLGLRDREIVAPKPANEIRVLLMGDSVPFGVGVTYEETIPAQLEGLMNQDVPAGYRYRVINMGVPSYNTEQELIQLQTLGLSLAPDLVLLMFSMNDIESKGWVYDKRATVLADFAQRSYALSLVFVGVRMFQERLGGAPPAINYAGFVEDGERWLAIRRSLLEMSALLHSRGVPLLVLVRERGTHRHVQLLKSLSNEGRFVVATIDPSVDSRWSADRPNDYVNSTVDAHCNPTGCSIVANGIHQLLGSVKCGASGCKMNGLRDTG